MPSVQLGFNSKIGYRAVTSTSNLGTVASEFLLVNNFSFKRDQPVEFVEEIGLSRRSPRRQVRGMISAKGGFSRYPDPNNGNGLYKFLLAGSSTAASQGSGTFTHTISEDDEVDGGYTNQQRLIFEINQGGDSTTTRLWWNGIPESYDLSVEPGKPCEEKWNFLFSDHGGQINTTSADSVTYTPPLNFNRATLALGTSITTVSIVATNKFGLSVNNNISQNPQVGTNAVVNFSYGKKEISGNFELIFTSLTEYNNFVTPTALAMRLQLESEDVTSGTNHYIRINLPEVHYEGQTPEVNDFGQIMLPVSFKANYSSNAAYQMQIVIFNSESALNL